MKTGYQGEAQVVFIEEDEPEPYRDSTGIEYDFLSCLEVMEIRIIKRIDDAIYEQNKKLDLILETLGVSKPLKQSPQKSLLDKKYIEIPYDVNIHNTEINEHDPGDVLTENFTVQDSQFNTQTDLQNFEQYSQELAQDQFDAQPEKKRKLEESTQPIEVEVVECVEVIPTDQTTPVNFNDHHDYEVEIEVEQIEELPNTVIPPLSYPNPIRTVKHPTIKVQAIPSLPINNIDVLRGFNRSLMMNREMANEFIQILRQHCGDDPHNAPARLITSIIGESVLVQSTWASKSSGRLRISYLHGIVNCMQKAAAQSSIGGLDMGLIREKVMELLHTIKPNVKQPGNSSLKKENFV